MTQARYALEPLTRLFRRAHSLSQRLILELLVLYFDKFHWNCYIHQTNQIHKTQIPCYKVKLNQILKLNL